MTYPKKVLHNVYWAFDERRSNNLSSFKAKMEKYYKEVLGMDMDFGFNLNMIDLPTQIVIQYTTIENNDLVEKEFLLESDSENSFTNGELLYKIHNKVYEPLKNTDAVYFEGLILVAEEDPENPEAPLYMMMLGS